MNCSLFKFYHLIWIGIFLYKHQLEPKELENLEVKLLALAASCPKAKELLLKSRIEFSTPELKSLNDLVLKEVKPFELLDSILNEEMRKSFTETVLLEGVDLEKMALDYLNRIEELKTIYQKRELREIAEKEGWTPERLSKYQKLTTKINRS